MRGPSVFFDSEEFQHRYLPPTTNAETQSQWQAYRQWCRARPLRTKAITAVLLVRLADWRVDAPLAFALHNATSTASLTLRHAMQAALGDIAAQYLGTRNQVPPATGCSLRGWIN